MNEQKLLSLLGIAQRSGKALSGEFAIEKSVRAGKVKCLIIAADASENTRKSYRDMAQYYGIPYFESLSREALSSGIGKENRAAVAVADSGLAGAVIKLLSETP